MIYLPGSRYYKVDVKLPEDTAQHAQHVLDSGDSVSDEQRQGRREAEGDSPLLRAGRQGHCQSTHQDPAR